MSLQSNGGATNVVLSGLTNALNQQQRALQSLTSTVEHNEPMFHHHSEDVHLGDEDEHGVHEDHGDSLTLGDLMFAMEHVKRGYPHMYHKMAMQVSSRGTHFL